MLQAIKSIPSQIRRKKPDRLRLLRRMLHVFTIPYYTVKAVQTDTIAIQSVRQAARLARDPVSRPTPRNSVYLVNVTSGYMLWQEFWAALPP
jgi:hypothetical protein